MNKNASMEVGPEKRRAYIEHWQNVLVVFGTGTIDWMGTKSRNLKLFFTKCNSTSHITRP